jgi:hypothetical protein
VKRALASLAAVGAVLAHPCGAQPSTLMYREPSSFTQLSAAIIDVLNNEGCRVPQGIINNEVVSTNVISGEFAQKGQTDWAVLCSRQGRQYIRIFWGGPARCPSRIPVGSGGDQFDRAIGTAGRKFIMDRHKAYGGPKPPPIAHLGINYQYLERASVVHYCHRDKWLELTGAD